MLRWRFWMHSMAWNEKTTALSEKCGDTNRQHNVQWPACWVKCDGKRGKCDGVFSENHCQKSMALCSKELRKGGYPHQPECTSLHVVRYFEHALSPDFGSMWALAPHSEKVVSFVWQASPL